MHRLGVLPTCGDLLSVNLVQRLLEDSHDGALTVLMPGLASGPTLCHLREIEVAGGGPLQP